MVAAATFLLTDGDGAVLGVAFPAPVLDAQRTGSFLLTAAHCVRSLFDGRKRVRIRTAGGQWSECTILLCTSDDVALLHHPEWLADPRPCFADHAPGAVSIRGAPAGVTTEQATFVGRLAGVEDGLLDIVLQDLTLVERRDLPVHGGPSATYRALRGLSGGPVWRTGEDGVSRVIGLVTHRNTSGIANRIYGIPIDRVAAILARRDVTLQLTIQIAHVGMDRQMLTGLIGDLINDADGALKLWSHLSGLFYKGEPIDKVLEAMLAEPQRHRVNDDLPRARLEYVYGRLLLKRDNGQKGLTLIHQARSRVRRADPADREGLGALMDLRFLLEDAQRGSRPVRAHAYLMEMAIDRVGQIDAMPDERRAYEIASAAGREAVLAYLEHPPPWSHDDPTRAYYSRLKSQHASLLHKYGMALRDKQEIVQIGLAVVPAIWDLTSGAMAEVRDLMELGKVAATQRSNAIFYAQMLLIEIALARAEGRDLHAYTLACLTTQALRNAGLLLTHEGIAAILRYVRTADPALYRFINMVHHLGIRRGIELAKIRSGGERSMIEDAGRIAELYADQVRDIKGIMTLRLDALE
ncbi:hypothetical protein GCM10009555_050140 [Acrocarpospora macrocephala]|uniref:Trypsin-like peptidase domain-containing protein n=1 Tax=Acrocarpospora macrocephala TaxID=150177 RepID=A0A5M3WU25_9ACTN|nr:hypothetical protein [Acrocarpospora macrocephala]GES12865.1 hypothetical protein Amac_064620 [Acrocarpospora macrocephala]